MTEPKIYHVKGTRPTRTPAGDPISADWLIFNAPRPLYGELTWEGPFLHGTFYAASAPRTLEFHYENIDLDGWLLEWHTEAEIIAWVTAEYTRKIGKFDATDYDQADLDMSFFLRHNGGR
jgi:hypothetical protein